MWFAENVLTRYAVYHCWVDDRVVGTATLLFIIVGVETDKGGSNMWLDKKCARKLCCLSPSGGRQGCWDGNAQLDRNKFLNGSFCRDNET